MSIGSACGGEPPASPPVPEVQEPLQVGSGSLRATAYLVPGRGAATEVTAGSCPAGAELLNKTRSLVFPEGASQRAVSSTAKTICFELRGTVHCHTSGTSTGFCDDWGDNAGNAIEWGNLSSVDGDFLKAYLLPRTLQQPRPRLNLSGHSQGGADVAQVARLLEQGDQMTLLQPAAAALYMKDDMHHALQKGATINIAWSAGDEASITIRTLNSVAQLPLIEMPKNVTGSAEHCGVRLHNAPNARHVFMGVMGVPAGYTVNPALDASIISNPGSPCPETGNIQLTCPATVPWLCPIWRD
jgi:hypothetical protein